jgi:NAD(P)-dependent dehydrogenase (short-subunit alcohol dehydrogenase family)
MELHERVALVTGASRGIGAATAKLLAANDRGKHFSANDSAQNPEDCSQEVEGACHHRIHSICFHDLLP